MTIPIPSMPAVAELKRRDGKKDESASTEIIDKLFPVEPKEVVGDGGCTGFPDGYWRHCCVAHDYAYADGGPLKKRKEADKKLRDCVYGLVADRHGIVPAWLLSRFMYGGVRVFGSQYALPLYLWEHWAKRARWGFGRQQ